VARHIARSRDRSATSAPEQQKNIAAIVWLYRGQQERFLKPVESYIAQAISEGEAATAPLEGFEEVLGKLIDLIEPFASIKRKDDPLAEPWDELTEGQATLQQITKRSPPRSRREWHAGRAQCGTIPGSPRRAWRCTRWRIVAET
jgi:type I restriction enzyme M protein